MVLVVVTVPEARARVPSARLVSSGVKESAACCMLKGEGGAALAEE